MDFLFMLASLGLGIREEYRAQNGIVTKEQQRSLKESAECVRRHEERVRKRKEEYKKRQEEIAQGRWYG